MAYSYTNISASTAAVANRFVTSTNMKVGAYTLANSTPLWQGGCVVTFSHVSVTGTDTLGTVVIVGTDLTGAVATETLTPTADSTVTGSQIFRSITSITGVGWVINTGNDTITCGVAAGAYVCGSQGTLGAIVINATAAAAVTISDKSRTIATLPSSATVGNYNYGCDFAGFLKIATTSTNDLTIIHSGTLPSSIAL